MNIIELKTYFVFIFVLIMISSCAKQSTLEERLASKDKTVARAALFEIWRAEKNEYVMDMVNYLSDPELKDDAAFALAIIGNEIVDKIVINRMQNAADKTGYLYYTLLRQKTASDRAAAAIASGLKTVKINPSNAPEQFLYDAAAGDYKNAVNVFEGACEAGQGKKEFILLLGEKKYLPAYPFLEKLAKQIPEFKPYAVWAMRRIKPARGIIVNKPDRTITQNPYWKKYGYSPVMPTVAGTFKSIHTANPDILTANDLVYFYYRGGDGNDRIALATAPYSSFNGVNLADYPDNPIINIGKDSFDDLAVLDPATLIFKDKVFLYYSGLGRKGIDAVGLAVSKDRYVFEKYGKNPVITGRAPEVVLKDGVIYLYYVMPNEYSGYSIFLATSVDGYSFTRYGSGPVFGPGAGDEWDSKSVTVQRIREKDGVYYMFYAGDDKYRDYPPYFGVAFSYDLVHWYRGTQNPVFSRGKKGAWDDGGIWFPEVFPYKNKLYLYYEGWGGGESHEKEYGTGGHSQIGLAISDAELEDML
jgi:hypothetical protein